MIVDKRNCVQSDLREDFFLQQTVADLCNIVCSAPVKTGKGSPVL